MQTGTARAAETVTDTFPINGTDYRRVLRRKRQAGEPLLPHSLRLSAGGYRGPETGTRDRATYLLQQNKVRLILTSPITPTIRPQLTWRSMAMGFGISRSGWMTRGRHSRWR